MLNVNLNRPDLYMPASQWATVRTVFKDECHPSPSSGSPSSGSMVSVKLSKSAGSGKSVFIVLGSSSSVKSVSAEGKATEQKGSDQYRYRRHPI